MIVSDPNYREDNARSIFIDGVIDNAAFGRIAPRVLELRAAKAPQITVYINSNGGNPSEADSMLNMLKFVGVDGYTPWVITVAVGNAKSAAANLLALGSYAIAYPHASIHFHGVRYSEVPNLTVEDASDFKEILARKNSEMALRLANGSIHRTVLHFLTQRSHFADIKKELALPDLPDSECFYHLISSKLKSDASKRVIRTAMHHYKENKELSEVALARANKVNSRQQLSATAYEILVLRGVIAQKTKKKSDKATGLPDEKLNSIVSSFKLLRDYHVGPHTLQLKSMIKRYGPYFLSLKEKEQYESLQTGDAEAQTAWLENAVWPTIKPFWYMVVATWQAMQEEENPMTPSDAYWLGAIDEVAGTDLCVSRTLVEEVSEKQAPISETSGETTFEPPNLDETRPTFSAGPASGPQPEP